MNMKQNVFKRAVLTTAVLSAAGATMAEELALEEVLVTAQKRVESLQDAPIAVSAFSTRDMENLGITDLTDLRGNVPSLNIAPFAATRASPVIFLRGMGNIDIQSTRDGTVGVYIDGVTIGRASGLATDIADLERVEVLRGPQGTLYGRNTTGGAINFITRKPGEELGVRLQATGGNEDYRRLEAMVNIPITDTLFTKVSYMDTERDGWVENTNSTLPGQVDLNEDDNQAGNIALRWLASDNFTVDLGYDRSELDYGNGYYQITSSDLPAFFPPHKDRLDKTKPTLANGMSGSDSTVDGGNLTLAWELGNVTLKSITGYRELDDSLFQNYNELFVQANTTDQHQFSQELQAIGVTANDRLQYVVGVYYFDESSDEAQDTLIPGIPAPAPYNTDSWEVSSDSESTAVYGQGTWTPDILGDRMRLTLGLRYTEDERSATKTYLAFGTPIGPLSGDKDFDKLNPSFTVDYAFTDDISSYAKVATGYRAGGFGTRGTAIEFANGFDEEDVTSYEIGLKSELWDQRIRLNAAAFYNDYEDLQISQKRNPEIFTDIINAGEASVAGAEVELTALLSDHFTFDLIYAYLDAEYDEYLDGGVDYSDVKKMPYAPDYQGKSQLEYTSDSYSFGRIEAIVSFEWQDKTWSGPDPDSYNDSYELWNARLQLVDIPMPKGSMRLGAWGKNLSDEEYTIITTRFNSAGFTSSMFGTPRTYGVDVIYEF
jgi:iron complex outermembrane receptor protein